MKRYFLKRQVAVLLSILAFFNFTLTGQTFTEVRPANLQDIDCYSIDWGDYDNDGDLDLLIVGYINSTPVTQVWRNDGGDNFVFQNTIALAGNGEGVAKWGDYNNDNLLDIYLTGGYVNYINRIYRNDGSNIFTEFVINNDQYSSNNFEWLDYDNDGDLDILSRDYNNPVILRNQGNEVFNEIAGLTDLKYLYGSIKWGDFDNDNYCDFIICGTTSLGKETDLFKNTGHGSFEKITTDIEGFAYSCIIVSADYNNDGKLDFLISGSGTENPGNTSTGIYKNLGNNTFSKLENISINGFLDNDIEWADFDNDGDLDLLVIGAYQVYVYRNDGDDQFINIDFPMGYGTFLSGCAVDYDNDGDLDIVASGYDYSIKGFFKIYKNNSSVTNDVPSAPEIIGLVETPESDMALEWHSVRGDETYYKSMTYNIMLGSSVNGIDIFSPQADLSGYRKIVNHGNAGLDTIQIIKGLAPGTYYWRVQAIDNGYKGSPFSDQGSFTISEHSQSRNITVSKIEGNSAFVQWQRGTGDKCIVCVREGDFVTIPILNSVTYYPDNNYGDGSLIGDGWYCVYNGEFDSITVKGLGGGNQYNVVVMEYTGLAGQEQYLSEVSEDNLISFYITYFTEISTELPGLYKSSMAWGDYDNNGYLDLLVTGWPSGESISKVYKNNTGDNFNEVASIILDGVYQSSVSWIDYDNDSDLDIFISGLSSSGNISKIYRNEGSDVFQVQDQIVLDGISEGAASWGDYDNDGDLDLLLCGSDISKIFRNNGDNTFSEQYLIKLQGLKQSSASWGDYDNDGDLDILMCGNGTTNLFTKIYSNEGNNKFIEQSGILLPGVEKGSIEWGDFDGDRDLDILLTGSNTERITKLFMNNGNSSFTEVPGIDFPGVREGMAKFIDFNNDGNLDIFVCGEGESTYLAKLYCNNGNGEFSELSENNFSNYIQYVVFGDYDKDGDLDIIAVEYRYGYLTRLYRNNSKINNQPPAAPENLQSDIEPSEVLLTWDEAVDIINPSESLTYNVRVGKTNNGNEIVSSHSDLNGLRSVQIPGNAQLNTSFIIKNILPGEYYWRVQAVDNSFVGGSFSPVKTFIIDSIQSSNLSATIKSGSSVLLHWKRGNGTKCIMFGKLGNDGLANPVDSISYEEDNTLGVGDEIPNTGWYCVYNGRADSVLVNGLVPGYSYIFHVIEYIGHLGSETYFNVVSLSNHILVGTSLFLEKVRFSSPLGTKTHDIADFNNDGFPDIAVPAYTSSGWLPFPTTRIMRNEGGLSFNKFHEIEGVSSGSIKWYDYNDDHKPDLFLNGENGNIPNVKHEYIIYKNDLYDTLRFESRKYFGTFFFSSSDWADYNNDGTLDVLNSGIKANAFLPVESYTTLFKCEQDTILINQEVNGLPQVSKSSVAWNDYDNDGLTDLTISGATQLNAPYLPVSKILHNDNNNLFNELQGIIIPGLYNSSISWGDYDNDGYSDLLLSGLDSNDTAITKLYHNEGGNTFTLSNQYFPGIYNGCSAWGDYDNDGDLDLLIAGRSISETVMKIYRNENNHVFNEMENQFFPGIEFGKVSWCDLDNDGDLDIFINGKEINSNVAIVYQNCLINEAGYSQPNSPPDKPTGLRIEKKPNSIILSWDPVTNDITPVQSLTYNVRIDRVNDNDSTVVNSLSSYSGYHRVSGMGNSYLNTFYIINNLKEGIYTWSVQAVDQGYMGGAWSAVDSFEVKNVQTFFSSDIVCQGFATQFTDQSVATEGIASWLWDFNDGESSSDQDPAHIYAASGTYYVKLIITDTGGAKDSLIQEVFVKQKPVADFSAPDVCQGTAAAITNTTDKNGLTISSWYWDFGDGQTSLVEQPADHGYLGAAEYTVQLKALADNSCRDSVTKTVTVASYPVAAVTANAPLSFCKGDSVTLSVPYNNEYLYTWKLDGTALSGADSSSFVAKLSGSYTAEVVNSKGSCKTTSSATAITANDAPSPPTILTTGGTTLCQGDSVVLSVTNTTGYSYQWRLNGGSVGTDSNIYIARSSGLYDLVVANSTGCKATSVNPVPVVVNPLPILSIISVKGNEKFCSGESATLSVPANAAYSYNWRRGANLLDITTNSIIASEPGDYTVDISLAGCSVTAESVSIEVIQKPSKPDIDKGSYTPPEMCLGENPPILSVDNIVTGYTYQWYKNETPISKSEAIEITEAGNYYLEAVTDICRSERDTAIINFSAAPPKPEIIVKGPPVWFLSTTSKASRFKWYFNGSPITDATGSSYIAGQYLGLYRLAVADESGCYSFSDTIRIPLGITGIEDTDPFEDVRIYPNPTTGMFTIEMNNNVFGELVIDIFTQSGSKILNIKFDKSTERFSSQIDLSGQSNGMYLINLSLDKFKAVRKVVVE